MPTNYSEHAAYWNWDEYDNSEIYSFWAKMSDKYGKSILSAMCAIGQAAAYMANNGYRVTALDYTTEMISEGNKRFGSIEGLDFVQADICNFTLKRNDYDFCFVDSGDIHLLYSIEMVKMALQSINKHLRIGGGLGIQIWYPAENSFSTPMQRFNPRVPRKDGIIIWKESESNYNADIKTQSIHQIIHVEMQNLTKTFDHFVTLHLYDKDVLFNLFYECGYDVVGQYCDYEFNTSSGEYTNCYVELRKNNLNIKHNL